MWVRAYRYLWWAEDDTFIIIRLHETKHILLILHNFQLIKKSISLLTTTFSFYLIKSWICISVIFLINLSTLKQTTMIFFSTNIHYLSSISIFRLRSK